jgi:hypothetical protein
MEPVLLETIKTFLAQLLKEIIPDKDLHLSVTVTLDISGVKR